MAQASARSLTSSLDKLHISQSGKVMPTVHKATRLESWEDEADEEDEGSGSATPVRPTSSSDYPGAPPPTPSSPSYTSGKTPKGLPYQTFPPFGMESTTKSPEHSPVTRFGGDGADDQRRPDKSTAVASRLIAAGIGQKAPRRTKEQREYDQAMKVQEKKKRDQAKSEEERRRGEVERAKQAMWDD